MPAYACMCSRGKCPHKCANKQRNVAFIQVVSLQSMERCMRHCADHRALRSRRMNIARWLDCCSLASRQHWHQARLPEQVQRQRALYRHARHHHHNPLEGVAAHSDAHRVRASRPPLRGLPRLSTTLHCCTALRRRQATQNMPEPDILNTAGSGSFLFSTERRGRKSYNDSRAA